MADPELAAALLRARRTGRRVPLGEGARPATLADAYAVARAVTAGLGRIGGAKIGATSARGQRALRLAEPLAGLVPTDRIVPAPARWIAGGPVTLDAEIMFELREAPRDDTREALRAAVRAVRLGMEVNAPRWAAPFEEGGLAIVADSGANDGLVLGPMLTDWSGLAALEVSLIVDAVPRAGGRGADVLGDPWRALAWFVRFAAAEGIDIAGFVVASGAMASVDVSPGQTAIADFGAAGSVTVAVASSA